MEGCTERLATIKFGKIFRSRGKERWSDFHFLPSHIYNAHHNSAILWGTGSVFRSCQSLTLLPLSLLSPPLLLLHWNYKNKRAPRDKYELSTHPKTTSSAIKMCGCKGQPCSLFPAFNWPLPQLPYRDAHGPPSSFHSLITFCLFPVFLNSNLAHHLTISSHQWQSLLSECQSVLTSRSQLQTNTVGTTRSWAPEVHHYHSSNKLGSLLHSHPSILYSLSTVVSRCHRTES